MDLDEELKNCPDSTKENENSIDRLLAFYNSPKYQALNDEELEALTSGKTPLLTYRLKYPRARRRNSDINYVDEAGRPVDISEIDMDLARFYDEWGRSVDYSGELIITVGSEAIPESQIINAAEKMIIKNKYHQLVKHCAFYLEDESHSKNPRILYLLGFGFANLRNIQRARETFLESILANLPQIDSMVFVNYITSCFDLSDKDSALKMIEQYFEDFDSDCKKMVLESLLEAVRTKLVSISDLSQKMRILLEIGESFGADSRFKDNFKFSDVLMGSVVGYWKFLLRTVPERAEDVRSFFLNGGVTLLIEVQKETLTPLVEAFLELKPEIGNNEIEIDMLIELFRVINISFQSLAAEWAQVPEIDREDYVHSSDELRRLLRVYLSFDFALQTFRRQTQNVH